MIFHPLMGKKKPMKNFFETPVSANSAQRGRTILSDDTDLSDSSLEFIKDDPFASSEESDWKSDVNGDGRMIESSAEDSEEDIFPTFKAAKQSLVMALESSSSDERVN